MRFLTSIELLRRLSRQLLTEKRELPPVSQLSSMEGALRYVITEATLEKMDLVMEYLKNLVKAVQTLQNEAQSQTKQLMIKVLVDNLEGFEQEDQKWEACKALSTRLVGLDKDKFDDFVSMRDKTRTIRLISNTATIKAMTPTMVEQLSKYLDTCIEAFIDVAYGYYMHADFAETPEIIDTMRYIVARKKGLKGFIT